MHLLAYFLAKLKADIFPCRISMSMTNEAWLKFKVLTIYLPFFSITSICPSKIISNDRFSYSNCHCKSTTITYARLTIKANRNEEWRRDEFYHLKWIKNEHRWEVSLILEYDAGNREILPFSEIFYMWNVQVYLEATLKLRKQCCSFKATMPFLEYRFRNNLTINLLTVHLRFLFYQRCDWQFIT